MELEELKEIVIDKLGVDADMISESTRFTEDLGADSLDLYEIVIEVEDKLQIKLPDDVLKEIKTVEDALEAINDAV